MPQRVADLVPQYTAADGTLLAGGTLNYYITNTTTPKSVYPTSADAAALTNSLGAVLTLDSDARLSEDPFYADDVAYRVVLKNSAGVTIWTRDNCGGGASGTSPPLDPTTGDDLQVYSTDGTTAYWRTVSEVPDPTGHTNSYLTSDGSEAQWTTIPAATTYDSSNLPGGITATTTKIQIGTQVLLKGTGTCPTSGTTASTVAVSFGYTFSGAPDIWVTATVGPVTGESARCSMQALSASTTGFTASAFAGAEDGGGSLNISTAVTFSWMAWGTAP